jgi:hypothetical protein
MAQMAARRMSDRNATIFATQLLRDGTELNSTAIDVRELAKQNSTILNQMRQWAFANFVKKSSSRITSTKWTGVGLV